MSPDAHTVFQVISLFFFFFFFLKTRSNFTEGDELGAKDAGAAVVQRRQRHDCRPRLQPEVLGEQFRLQPPRPMKESNH